MMSYSIFFEPNSPSAFDSSDRIGYVASKKNPASNVIAHGFRVVTPIA
jgi:hypothetical protein